MEKPAVSCATTGMSKISSRSQSPQTAQIIPLTTLKCKNKINGVPFMYTNHFYCAFGSTTCNDFSSVARMKALRRCPDVSRKRDGIAVTALSFLLSPLDGRNIGMCSCVPLGREDRLLRCARREATCPGRNGKPTERAAHTKSLQVVATKWQ